MERQRYGEPAAPVYLTPAHYVDLAKRFGKQGREWILRRYGIWAKEKHKQDRTQDYIACLSWPADEWTIFKHKAALADEQKPLPKARDLRATYKDTSSEGALKGLELWSDTMKRLKKERK